MISKKDTIEIIEMLVTVIISIGLSLVLMTSELTQRIKERSND